MVNSETYCPHRYTENVSHNVNTTHEVGEVHLIHHDDGATLVIMNQTPQISHGAWQWHLGEYKRVALLVPVCEHSVDVARAVGLTHEVGT